MSLLSDLLSKIKQPQPKRDIPPNLKFLVSLSKNQTIKRRKIALLVIMLLLIVGSGFAAIFIFNVFSQIGHKKGLHIAKNIDKDIKVSKHDAIQNNKEAKSEEQEILKKSDKELKTESYIKGNFSQTNKEKTDTQKRKPDYNINPTEDIKKPVANRQQKTIQPQEEIIAADSKINTEKPETTKPDTFEKDLYLYLARDYELKGKLQDAVESYKKVLNIERKNYKVMNNIASILIKMKSYDEAKTYLQAAIELKKDYVPALINMAVLSACIGQYYDAEKYLSKALTLEPYNREALFNLAVLFERQGNTEKAKEYFIKLLEIGDKRGEAALNRLGH